MKIKVKGETFTIDKNYNIITSDKNYYASDFDSKVDILIDAFEKGKITEHYLFILLEILSNELALKKINDSIKKQSRAIHVLARETNKTTTYA